jgi:hydroxymethylbilane synthase
MGLAHRITQLLDPAQFVPAIGQGALGIETREAEDEVDTRVRPLDDPETRQSVEAERAFLRTLQGGCQVPVGALAVVRGADLMLQGMVAGLDGAPMLREEILGPSEAAEALGVTLGHRILDRGGRRILEALYGRACDGIDLP